jgi:alkaline phosphatase
MTPDGEPLTPLLDRVRRSGRRTGLVTTTRLTHATPAAWAASHPDRNDELPIALQMAGAGIDVMLGGGARYLDRALADGSRRAMNGGGYAVVRDAASLGQAARNVDASERLIGLFAEDHMAYEVDRGASDEPSIAEMTRVALDRLGSSSPGGFVLQVEGGRVDHAAHACDAASIVRDQLAFDDAVAEAVRFVEGRDDTLLIVTTDHGNASPSLTRYGESRLGPLSRASVSFDVLFPKLREAGWAGANPAELRDLIAGGLAVELGLTEIDLLRRAMEGEVVNPFEAMRGPHHVLGSLLANHTGVHFVSGNHTAEHVVMTATGPGAERIPGVGHLVDTHAALVAALGL